MDLNKIYPLKVSCDPMARPRENTVTYDRNTIYLKFNSPSITKDVISQRLDSFMSRAGCMSTYIVSYPTSAQFLGFAYVWLDNVNTYSSMATTNDPLGSDIKVSGAYVHNYSRGPVKYSYNSLCLGKVHPALFNQIKKDIEAHFSRFATVKSISTQNRILSFPHARTTKSGIVFVDFANGTRDAQFAMLICGPRHQVHPDVSYTKLAKLPDSRRHTVVQQTTQAVPQSIQQRSIV